MELEILLFWRHSHCILRRSSTATAPPFLPLLLLQLNLLCEFYEPKCRDFFLSLSFSPLNLFPFFFWLFFFFLPLFKATYTFTLLQRCFVLSRAIQFLALYFFRLRSYFFHFIASFRFDKWRVFFCIVFLSLPLFLLLLLLKVAKESESKRERGK